MSYSEEVESTGNKRVTNYNTEKLFIWENTFVSATYTNSTGSEVTLEEGTVMGRIATTGLVVPLEFDASDGSQFPIGILNGTYTVANGGSITVSICDSGEVNENLLVLEYGTTLNSVISSKRLRDRIGSDTVGVKLRASTEMTDYDNQ